MQAPLVAVPTGIGPGRVIPGPDYRLGPGDLLEIQIVGRVDIARHQVVVDLDGSINVPPLGSIPLAGATVLEAQRRVMERARQLFRFVDVILSIVTPRSVEVVLAGEVEHPGAFVTFATRRLHELIASVGGITPRGSMRRIKVTRGATTREVDLLRFELAGDVSQNPFVEEGMVVHVPPKGPSVTLSGAVRRPGEYELAPSGSLAELLALVGGLSVGGAASAARVTRLGPDGRKETLPVDLTTALTPPADVPLRGGEAVYVPAVTTLQDVIEVRGAFNGGTESAKTTTAGKPTVVQRIELAQGDRIRDVLTKVGGPTPLADLRGAMVERRPLSGPVQRIPIDMQRLLVEKDETQNIVLQNGDTLQLPVLEDKVYVLGEVRTPGAQDFRPDLTPQEYVALAGGPGIRAKSRNTFVTFRDGKTYAMSQAPPLEPGAVVTVPEVSVRWWQDYLLIAQAIASIVAAYTGIYIVFGGTTNTVFGTNR